MTAENQASLKGFTIQLQDIADKIVPEEVVALQKWVALNAFRRFLQNTPVDQGLLRGSWAVSIGSPDYAVRNTPSKAMNGQEPLPEEIQQMNSMLAQIASAQVGVIIWISNSQPYVARIEFGGHSKEKAPRGMVRISIEALRVELEARKDMIVS